ncbi:MAG: glycoside hydrolase family 127 protein [Alistipes sp.]|jgi:DUF1680 family protein|nr:glycoside hydrolase family 127 protein [Alistipes sp.]
MRKLVISLLVVAFGHWVAAGQSAPIAEPFASGDVTLTPSWVKDREELNIRFLRSLDRERLLHNFRVNAQLPSDAKPLGGWEAPGVGLRGHYVGHYLSALSTLVVRDGDQELSRRLEYIIDELAKCQQTFGNGYLSAFPERDFDVLETRFTGVWAPYYTYNKVMQGLLDAYTRTGNRKAYRMVVEMAGWAGRRMARLDRATIDRIMYTAQANPQNEPGAMNEVLYKLYEISGDPQHLALAGLFDPDWFANPLARGEDILSGLHSNTHLAIVNGFARRWSVTGETKYRDAVVNFWNMLIGHHAWANGSSSGPRPNATTSTSLTAEHWGDADRLGHFTKEIAESCVSHNTQKLTAYLFAQTADPRYADSYMNMFYNAVMAVQSPATGAYVYHLPLGSPRNKKYMKDEDFFCCSGSSLEAFTRLNDNIYFRDERGVWVNLYIPSKVVWREKGVELEQSGNFPKDTKVSLTVTARRETAFTLRLFVPSWSEGVEVRVNGEKVDVERRTAAAYVELARSWKNGDRVEMEFRSGFHVKPLPDASNTFAIFHGPTMLAFETRREVVLKGDMEGVVDGLSAVDPAEGVFELLNGGETYRLRPLFDVDEQSYGVYATIKNY